MKVSAVVAAYNIENYIERCIMSIVNQTLQDIEIIVVNDGSTDKTQSIIEDIAKKDSRIVVINQENQGSIEARKSGLKKSTGEYLLFIDGDDWLELDALKSLYETAKTNKSDIILYNGYISYDKSKIKKETFKKDVINSKDFLKDLFLNKISPSICFKFIKRSFINKNNIQLPSNISYAEDLATTSILFMHKPKINILDKYLYNYYQRENSIVNTVNNKVLDVDKAISCIEKNLKNKNIYQKYYKEFEYMVYIHLFIYRIILSNTIDDIYLYVHKQYKKRKVDIKNNIYIKKDINNETISARIRIYSYHTNYKLGVRYDRLRKNIKYIFQRKLIGVK